MITPPWYNDPVEQTAFNAYAFNTSELDEIAENIIEQINRTGCTSFSLEGISDDDLAYIKRIVEDRFND